MAGGKRVAQRKRSKVKAARQIEFMNEARDERNRVREKLAVKSEELTRAQSNLDRVKERLEIAEVILAQITVLIASKKKPFGSKDPRKRRRKITGNVSVQIYKRPHHRMS